MLRCPDPSCNAAIGQDMINSLAPEKDRQKYTSYFVRSYVEDNRKVNYINLQFHYSFGMCVHDV